MVLVATKEDLRTDSEVLAKIGKALTYEDGLQLKKDLGFYAYKECSALTQNGLKAVFDEAIRAATAPPPKAKKKGPCSLL